MKQVIFVGWVRTGKPPVDGETAKNQYIIVELKKYCKVTVLDFYQKNRHPWIFLQALWALVSLPKATIIFSTSPKNVYSTLKLFQALHLKREVIHWVIGGNFGDNIQNGVYDAKVFGYAKYTFVESHVMVKQLRESGIQGVSQLSNFKEIPYLPNLDKALTLRNQSKKTRFVFLSRIMADKGCDYILSAAKLLNKQGYADKFTIDFYGKIDSVYNNIFERSVNSIDNVFYHGLLNLKNNEGYDELSTYHAMLFPTYWRGEGFAGVFVDAFIAGLPIMVSDWAHNTEYINNGKTGIVFPTHNVESLREVMENCINKKINLYAMSLNARAEAKKYQTENVITEDLLKSVGLTE